LIVWPEVVIPNLGWLMSINQEKAFVSIYQHLKEYPQTTICTGGYGFTLTKSSTEEDPYASYDPANKYYYLTHNIALSITYGERSPLRSKAYFVPFQERIPLLKEIPFMANLADLVGGNAKISYYPNGVEIHQTKSKIAYTPMLCYESVFPLIMAEKSKESNLIVIAANENWNKDLSGSKQYVYNNVGMAIQSRIPIAKSSNSGVSAIIDKYGNILEERIGRNVGLIIQEVSLSEGPTFYVKIAGIFYWFSVICFLPIYFLFFLSSLKSFFVKKS
jgi:apolipoprotein N-acyltransferase